MISELLVIPGVGKKTVICLHRLGIYKLSDLKDKDPEVLYEEDCKIQNMKIDRCQLYVYRLAVFFAENDGKVDSNLRWWHFKDE